MNGGVISSNPPISNSATCRQRSRGARSVTVLLIRPTWHSNKRQALQRQPTSSVEFEMAYPQSNLDVGHIFLLSHKAQNYDTYQYTLEVQIPRRHILQ